ncbi:hypothetical protein [Alkalihalobacillus pseudalcaliphilus]|uniref:hypothetical protein n=1 Tax=Alkalihalobacillus pseudalcaliphilus TaxID=79884 RepID=UPI00064E0B3A|nr:hypothetical protein [Alkalihalobacillus pseudalcaliphilus]KMK78148.1 hypothetical protein AB990_01540 [Alkalihalobacillus pseudalcaliphilus]
MKWISWVILLTIVGFGLVMINPIFSAPIAFGLLLGTLLWVGQKVSDLHAAFVIKKSVAEQVYEKYLNDKKQEVKDS